jgi:hypothetical protein
VEQKNRNPRFSKIIVAFENGNANYLIREIVNPETPHIIAVLA